MVCEFGTFWYDESFLVSFHSLLRPLESSAQSTFVATPSAFKNVIKIIRFNNPADRQNPRQKQYLQSKGGWCEMKRLREHQEYWKRKQQEANVNNII